VLRLENGTYTLDFGSSGSYRPSPPSITLSVSGSPLALSVHYVRSYNLTFTEKGLSAGTSWAVDIAGITVSSTSGNVSVELPNGTYGFTIMNVSGHRISSAPTGYLAVNGAGLVVHVRFV
jgi:hypothetical protein